MEDPFPSCVKLSALPGGLFTMPERFFVTPVDDDAKKTVPSLSFLITHGTRRILFDLGLRSQVQNYSEAIQKHASTRQPLFTSPNVLTALADNGLSPSDIDFVILSHVHWDHIGDLKKFDSSQVIVGPGAKAVTIHGMPGGGSHAFFEADLLPEGRTVELVAPDSDQTQNIADRVCQWETLGPFRALDLMGDKSIYIVNAPGHLPGHINLFCRTQEKHWVYLGGDACHDLRLLMRTKEIATWELEGRTMCIHVDKAQAEKTLRNISLFQNHIKKSGGFMDIIMAHDNVWAESNKYSFLPGVIGQEAQQ